MPHRRLLAILTLCATAVLTTAAAANDDAVLAAFFAIWDDDARVTPAAVRDLYADRVVYYGRTMTADQVYADKRAFIRRWPDRHYAVVPGTVSKQCDRTNARCSIRVTLAWHAQSQARGANAGGHTQVSFEMVRQAGGLKIVREAGRPVAPPTVD